ncbi:MAG: GNAT family N-acetyltransferase [Actinomycetaceae bacterium]|nr:GNAT family N-acetyltransferase [Arcanobacterium sp.]MDD7504518.1 GNAT family N-acetyltransferase [Actinomycetaceae bacterium]MDY6142813.1 GNAT family N-acetyltransferase [Arcanobacterium sp.]
MLPPKSLFDFTDLFGFASVRTRQLGFERLAADELPILASIFARRPVETVLLADVLASYDPGSRSSYFLVTRDAREAITGGCWVGGNIIPWGLSVDQLGDLAGVLRARKIYANSIVGERCQVMPLWYALKPFWHGAPREVRAHQPLMVFRDRASVKANHDVRLAQPEDFDVVFPASVAMFTEEVGYDPRRGGSYYEKRVRSLIEAGRVFVHIGRDPYGKRRVVFKADIGAQAPGVAQIQGVWTSPDMRGQGIASSSMLALSRVIERRDHAQVCLYVNDFNHAALAAYHNAGYEIVGDFATVLL